MTKTAYLGDCPNLNTEMFLNALRVFAQVEVMRPESQQTTNCAKNLFSNIVWTFNPQNGSYFDGAFDCSR